MPCDLLSDDFPIVHTRDLNAARQWLRERTDPKERCGLLASSGALRLRAHGIEVSSGFRKAFSYNDWFLSGAEDVRSSGRLEVAATEFDCQGLELDWSGVCWGGDFLMGPQGQWRCRSFRGSKWTDVREESSRRYLANKYRVLLTRARKGMVIWVPRGDAIDSTRDPVLLDATARFLLEHGVASL